MALRSRFEANAVLRGLQVSRWLSCAASVLCSLRSAPPAWPLLQSLRGSAPADAIKRLAPGGSAAAPPGDPPPVVELGNLTPGPDAPRSLSIAVVTLTDAWESLAIAITKLPDASESLTIASVKLADAWESLVGPVV